MQEEIHAGLVSGCLWAGLDSGALSGKLAAVLRRWFRADSAGRAGDASKVGIFLSNAE